MRRSSLFMASAIAVIIAITAFGCGSYSPSETVEKEQTTGAPDSKSPSETVEEFYQATMEKDCQKVVALVKDDDSQPGLVDKYVEDCRQGAGKLVSYRILEEDIDEIGLFARVVTDVTFMEGDQEKTNTGTIFLIMIGNDWKLTKIR